MSQVLLGRKTLRRIAQTAQYRVSKIAKHLRCTPVQVRRRCHQAHGCPPKRLLISWRLQQAAQLLRAGKPVKFVASDVGFRHVSSFCRHFKEAYGLRPVEYARKGRYANNRKTPKQ